MRAIFLLGRLLLGVSFAIFGILHLLNAQTMIMDIPVFLIDPIYWVYGFGVIWLLVAVSFLSGIATTWSGILVQFPLTAILVFDVILRWKGTMDFIQVAFILGLMGGALMIAAIKERYLREG